MTWDLEVSIFEKITRDPVTGCWEWTASKDSGGYGHVWVRGRLRQAHRVTYEMFVGPIPEGLEIDHLCRDRACVNPEHLEAVTHQENCERGTIGEWGRLTTHCPHGHEYTPENTRRHGVRRHCRICQRAAQRRWRAKRNAKMVFSREAVTEPPE